MLQHEGPAKAEARAGRLETLNRYTLAQWRRIIESGPFDVLEYAEQPNDYATAVLREFPEVRQTLLPGVEERDLTVGRIHAWLRNSPRPVNVAP